MKIKSNTLTLLGAVLASMLIIGCSQAAAAATAAVDDTPEGSRLPATARGRCAASLGRLRSCAAWRKARFTVDEEVFKKHANDVVTLGGMIHGRLHSEQRPVEGTAALPDIWTN